MDEKEKARVEENRWLVWKLREPTTFEKISKSIRLHLANKSKINNMRKELLQEFHSQFITYLNEKSDDVKSNQISASYFEKRMNTLPKRVIFDLYEDFLKLKQMETERGKDAVKNAILESIELSYSLNDWFRKELIEQIKNK
jgi:hypothetical protein